MILRDCEGSTFDADQQPGANRSLPRAFRGFAASMRSQEVLGESHVREEHPFLLLSKFCQRHAGQSKVEVVHRQLPQVDQIRDMFVGRALRREVFLDQPIHELPSERQGRPTIF